jgi:hypothetical protein
MNDAQDVCGMKRGSDLARQIQHLIEWECAGAFDSGSQCLTGKKLHSEKDDLCSLAIGHAASTLDVEGAANVWVRDAACEADFPAKSRNRFRN